MEELLKNETVRMKIKSLSPPIKKAFIESLLDLYEQETEEMIDVIEESRLELMGHFNSFEDESKSLRAESRLLEDRRKNHDNDCVQKYVQRKGMSSRNSASSLSYVDEETNSKSIKEYLQKRGKKTPSLAEDMRSHSSTRPPTNKRADSVMSTRSLPTPVTRMTVEEEKDAVMKNLSSANRQTEVERQRQAELIAKRREQRRAQKQSTEEKALELLEKALAMDKKLAERKQEQDQKIKDRLEDMKRKRAESRMDFQEPPNPVVIKTGGERRRKTSDPEGVIPEERNGQVNESEDRRSKTNNPEKIKSSDRKDKHEDKSDRRDDRREDSRDKHEDRKDRREDRKEKREDRKDKREDRKDKREDRKDKREDRKDKKEERRDKSDRPKTGKREEQKSEQSIEQTKADSNAQADYDFTIY